MRMLLPKVLKERQVGVKYGSRATHLANVLIADLKTRQVTMLKHLLRTAFHMSIVVKAAHFVDKAVTDMAPVRIALLQNCLSLHEINVW